MAPFAGNNMLVLYSCDASSSKKYLVQVLHNERPIHMPVCNNTDFCPLEVFKENVIGSHLQHDYDTICNAKPSPQSGGIDKQELYSIAQCVTVVCLAAGDQKCSSTIKMLTDILRDDTGSNSAKQHLTLLCLGELGLRKDLNSQLQIENIVIEPFQFPFEEIKSAAAYDLAGLVDIDFEKEPSGTGKEGPYYVVDKVSKVAYKLKLSSVLSVQLTRYFSKGVVYLLRQKTVSLMNSIQANPTIIKQLIDLIETKSVREILIRLIGDEEHIYKNHTDAMHWIKDADVWGVIVDQCRSLEFPEGRANADETLVGIARVTISEIAEGMLGSVGDLSILLDVSSSEKTLSTAHGRWKLQEENKHQLKVMEFIAALVNMGSQTMEKRLIHLEIVPRILGLSCEYPYNNFLQHHIESIIVTGWESKDVVLIVEILGDRKFYKKIIEVKNDAKTPPADGRSPPIVEFIVHLSRICNTSDQRAYNRIEIQKILQENNGWTNCHTHVLFKRNAVVNVDQWASGRPTTQRNCTRDSDAGDYQGRNYYVAALAKILNPIFRYGNDSQGKIDETCGSLRIDDDL